MNKSRYAFNGRFLTKQLTGQERYATELLACLDGLCEKGEFCVVTSKNALTIPKYRNIEVIQTGTLKREVWEQFCLGPWLRKHNMKCVNLTSTYALGHCEVVCIHDASIYEIGNKFIHSAYGFFGLIWKRFLCGISARRAEKILTVSNYSKEKLHEILKIPYERIFVISNAWQHYNRVQQDDSILERLSFAKEGEYFFAMSSLSPQKNFVWIMEVAKRNPKLQFVITGKAEGFTHLGADDLKTDNLHFTGYLKDGEIKSLMKHCRAFIHPAIYEGFGIPPIEALSCGAQLILSPATCLPEIYGKSAHYIDPYNYDVDLDVLLKEPVAPAAEVLDKYSWEEEAKKLLKLLRE